MKKFFVISISLIFIALYIYLSIPIQISYNFMGIDMSTKMQYQPLTTCVSYDMKLGVETAHNKQCGISPIQIFKMKTNKNNPYNLLQQGELEQINQNYKQEALNIEQQINYVILIESALQKRNLDGMNSKQLTDFFSQRFIVKNQLKQNKIEINNGMFLEFISNGNCEKGNCKIIVDLNGTNKPNKKWTKADKPSDIIELKLNKENDLEYKVILPKFIKLN